MNITQTEQKYVKDVYENIAQRFNHTRAYKWCWIDEFLSKLAPNSNVYDLGCGNGRNMNFKDLKFIGVDNCTNFIKICQEKNLDVINCNILNIPLESNSADAIICIDLDYETVGSKGGMLMVAASGTAIKL